MDIFCFDQTSLHNVQHVLNLHHRDSGIQGSVYSAVYSTTIQYSNATQHHDHQISQQDTGQDSRMLLQVTWEG